ncbi:MAG: aminopeptidase P family N-terminal domain-containing protein, partial [Bryobacteraceae bacterium]|nr:aminopeptidase P family N-terminal domain-containing protein [Bryobacteraceae bacterium]
MSECSERRSRVASRLDEHQVDALLVSAPSNIRYLSGFTGSNAALLISRDSATLFTDSRYTIQAAEQADCPVIIVSGP